MAEKPKSLFDKAIDALFGRDKDETKPGNSDKLGSGRKVVTDREAAARAAAERAAAEKMLRDQQEASRKLAESGGPMGTPRKGVVTVRSLHIRQDHDANSAEVGGLVRNQEVSFTETWTDGQNTWVKLGPDRWAAMKYKGETYIKLV